MIIIVSSSLRLSGELSEVTWELMLRWREGGDAGRLASVGWENRAEGPAHTPTLGSLLHGDQLECFPISLKGVFSLQLSQEIDGCQPGQVLWGSIARPSRLMLRMPQWTAAWEGDHLETPPQHCLFSFH